MTLYRSPESFSTQMDSTSLFLWFQLVTHGDEASFDPMGHHMNKIDKGLQGDAIYQISMLYPFQFQRRRILKLGLLSSYIPTCDPQGGVSFDPKESYE